MSQSLTAALSKGLRPLAIKASLQSWLGVPVSLKDGAFWGEFFGTGSFIGKRVSVNQALQLSTVWACVRLLSETLATLPLGFYKRNADGSRSPASSHSLYEILHNQPNADMTAVVFWEVVLASMLLWGNAYVEVIRSGNTVIALNFLLPSRVRLNPLKIGGYEYSYRDAKGGPGRSISQASMMHIPAFSLDGILGLSPVSYGVNVFGTSIETDRASAETFRDSLRSPGIVTMDSMLRKDQREDIREHVKTVSDKGGVFVLEKGASFQQLGFDPESAELLASRSFNVEEICRWFGLDPVMVGHGSKDSNWGTGLEQKMLWFLVFALRKWCVRIEQAVRKSLLTPVERLTYFAEFNLEGLLRGDAAGRASYLSTMWQNGGMTRNEGRAKENLPPMAGGDVLTVQSNLVPLDQLGKAPSPDRAAASALMTWLGLEQSAGAPAKE